MILNIVDVFNVRAVGILCYKPKLCTDGIWNTSFDSTVNFDHEDTFNTALTPAYWLQVNVD